MARPSLDDLDAFAAVARARSFTRAAAERRVSTSALSHRIKGLEAGLGVRLLARNSRSVSVTDEGALLLLTLAPALGEIDAALGALGRERGDLVSGRLRLTATRHGFDTVLRPALAGFRARHPRVRLEAIIETGLRDIVADGFDAGIRIGEKLEQDMIAVCVGAKLRMAAVASPDYLAEAGTPGSPQDLAAHRCINQRMLATGQTYDWEFEQDGRAVAVKVTGPFASNDPGPMLDAALAGIGIAYVLDDMAATHLAAGRLVRLLEDWTPPFPGYFLYYPSRRQMKPALAALVAILREQG